jgi:hypothetical protein
MLDQGVCDEKIVAYSTANPRFREIGSHMGVQQHIHTYLPRLPF